ncbi:hypothetical protein FRACYDRAFT_228936 [Fragilariopsis cylindrus CCMP1102]|uniref:Helicase-associated domain-containing protein n=1 Tax=Fragilariopsis cylindrus CCMP1102 TaxID=635003 RepID=A0A1E7EST1_9STRA|nr:hypothetical protein FRACYDRAFT_228936 [Fragilariopsis cylindrus CCMP1102]|eukprot:OEU09068.1 hypothetical protein FRACYDRAFT_228936 [Fragilariopsis cylindrus CCMP1102]
MRYSTLQNKKWDDMFQQLVAYKKEYKSTTVPISYEADPKLGTWVSNQRQFYKHRTIADHRVRRLDCIGFVWEMKEIVPWEEMYQRLVAYRNQHNSTNVSHRYQVDPKLGQWVTDSSHLGCWVSTQRQCYRKKNLMEKRMKLLNSIDFLWSVNRVPKR